MRVAIRRLWFCDAACKAVSAFSSLPKSMMTNLSRSIKRRHVFLFFSFEQT